MSWLIKLLLRVLSKSKAIKWTLRANKAINTAKTLGVGLIKKKILGRKINPIDVIKKMEQTNKNVKKLNEQLEKQERILLNKQEREHNIRVKQLEKAQAKDLKKLDKWLERKAKEQQQENKPKRIKNQETGIELLFNSSWILWGMFIHYWTKKRKDGNGFYKSRNGVMLLKLYNTTSKFNPSLIYQWIRVKYKDWKNIIEDKTGKNFWAVWYHHNRMNQRHLTMLSKYFNPRERVKEDIREFKKYNTSKRAIQRERARLTKYYNSNRRH